MKRLAYLLGLWLGRMRDCFESGYDTGCRRNHVTWEKLKANWHER